jgi:hypothetical protein
MIRARREEGGGTLAMFAREAQQDWPRGSRVWWHQAMRSCWIMLGKVMLARLPLDARQGGVTETVVWVTRREGEHRR